MRCDFLNRNMEKGFLMKHENVQEYYGKTLQSSADLANQCLLRAGRNAQLVEKSLGAAA